MEKTKDRKEEVTFNEALRNPVLWAVSLGLWIVSSLGLITLLLMMIINNKGGFYGGLSLFYSLFFIVSAGLLGYLAYTLSKKYGYKIDFEAGMLPFLGVAVGIFVLGSLGGIFLGWVFFSTVIACVLLIIPYMMGYILGQYGESSSRKDKKKLRKENAKHSEAKALQDTVISSIDEYSLGTEEKPGNTWSSEAIKEPENEILWTRSILSYASGRKEVTTAVKVSKVNQEDHKKFQEESTKDLEDDALWSTVDGKPADEVSETIEATVEEPLSDEVTALETTITVENEG